MEEHEKKDLSLVNCPTKRNARPHHSTPMIHHHCIDVGIDKTITVSLGR